MNCKISIYSFFLSCLVCAPTADAANPVLFFSDLESGPKTGWEDSPTRGAAVTLWGENFGPARGASFVTVNGAQLVNDSDYAEWGENLGPARDLDRITFWLNDQCNEGLGIVTVTVNQLESNSLPFTIRSGNLHYVSVSGSDNGDGSWRAPWRYIYQAKPPLITPGDIVYIREGTYLAEDNYNAHMAFRDHSGEVNSPLAYVAYPGENVTIGDGTLAACFKAHGAGDASHIVIAKFNLRPAASAIVTSYEPALESQTHDNWRVVGNDIDPAAYGQTGSIYFGSDSGIEDHKVFGNYVHDSTAADKYYHGLYVSIHPDGGHDFDGIEIAWNEFTNYQESSLLSIKPQPDSVGKMKSVIIHDNLLYNCTNEAIYLGNTWGDCLIYNNVIYDVGTNPDREAIHVNTFGENHYTRFFNNVIYDSGGSDGFFEFKDSSVIRLKNNIFYSVNDNWHHDTSFSGEYGSDNDLWFGSPAPEWATNPVASDPHFLDPQNRNFRLLSSSPAIDRGLTLDIDLDYDGNSRPMGSSYDIGAFEYTGEYIPDDLAPAPPANLNVVLD